MHDAPLDLVMLQRDGMKKHPEDGSSCCTAENAMKEQIVILSKCYPSRPVRHS